MLLHTSATLGWLRVAGALLDLREQAALLVHQAAQHRDTPAALGLATWGGLHVMLSAGEFGLAQAELDSVTVPTNSPESMQVAGMLALCRSFLAAAAGRPGDVGDPFDHAAELAERTGQGNAYWMGFGPQETGRWRAAIALETGDFERAAASRRASPSVASPPGTPARYWVNYGRALTRIRGRRDDAVGALLRAEKISSRNVYRDPIAREVIAVLLTRSRRDSPAGHELRRIAFRAGLPV